MICLKNGFMFPLTQHSFRVLYRLYMSYKIQLEMACADTNYNMNVKEDSLLNKKRGAGPLF